VIRSSTSAALNYGEAQSAESKKDFIHKNSVVLKELREMGISLKILQETNSVKDHNTMLKLLDECNQLTAIFQKTVTTARTKKY
jgi:four helix bundle protein